MKIASIAAITAVVLGVVGCKEKSSAIDISHAHWIPLFDNTQAYILPGGKECATVRDYSLLGNIAYATFNDSSLYEFNGEYEGLQTAMHIVEQKCPK